MGCPICGNEYGFACGQCIKCGYDHLRHEYNWIKVDVKLLRSLLSDDAVDHLIMEHEIHVKDKYK